MVSPVQQLRTQPLVAIMMLAAGCYLLGRLSLLAVIPPGYAVPIWPVAGLALAGLLFFGYRAWPGVTLASFALSLPAALASARSPSLASAIALGIATGATIQTVIAATLVRRFVGATSESMRLDRIGAMLVLAGPVACLVSATIGLATLWSADAVATRDVGFNWFTWWVGDAIGVLVVLPLYLVWTLDRRHVTQRTRIAATLAMTVLLVVISLLFVRTSALDRDEVEDEFTRRSTQIAYSLEQEIGEYTEALYAAANFLTVSDADIDRAGFGELVGDMLARHPGLYALSWSPRVSMEQRSAYERAVRAEGLPGLGIRELERGRLVPAGPRSEYVPVTYMEPYQRAIGALGFDLASETTRNAALQRARDTGRAAASARVRLVNIADERSSASVLIVAPAYRAGAPRSTVAERRRAVRGYVTAVLRVDMLMTDFLRHVDADGIRIRLVDRAEQLDGRVLVDTSDAVTPGVPAERTKVRDELVHRTTINVGERPWEFVFTLDDDSPQPYRSAMSWTARAVGLLFAGLFSAFMLVTVGRAAAVERQVQDRTAELNESNFALQAALAGHASSEQALFEEKERAQVTLGSIGDGVIVTDTAGAITYLNPIAEALTGWTAGEAEGRPVSDVFRLVAHSDQAPLPCPLTAAIQGNRRVGLSIEAELVQRDGRHLSVEDTAAPVHDRTGQVIGGVVVFHDVSEARAMQLKMAYLTRHDPLTGLPNRSLLQERLALSIDHARSRQAELALLYIDLDGFKYINDSLGHDVGDLLLQQTTQRLLGCVRSMDTVSRQGGDEFTILMPEIRSSSDAVRVADHVLRSFREPFEIGGSELNLTASVGIALYPADGDDAGVLLKHADAAMYQAKQDGRNDYRFFTREIRQRADRRLEIESALHQALRNEELVLHYQPKVSPTTGLITGMEALVRWQRPDGRLAMPSEFIEIAEDSGLIARIDDWVLEHACRQNRAWQDAGLPAVPVAVNLSAAGPRIEQFPGYLADVLERTGLAACHLQIEVTETQMLRDTPRFETMIHGIGALGVRIAIDDFGTGYSSLGYLHRFPFDVLKIDRSFVHALKEGSTEAAIVEAITRLASAFDFDVVAEGVETREQARILQAFGCHEMQGYLYSRPVPAAQFEPMLRAGRLLPALAET